MKVSRAPDVVSEPPVNDFQRREIISEDFYGSTKASQEVLTLHHDTAIPSEALIAQAIVTIDDLLHPAIGAHAFCHLELDLFEHLLLIKTFHVTSAFTRCRFPRSHYFGQILERRQKVDRWGGA